MIRTLIYILLILVLLPFQSFTQIDTVGIFNRLQTLKTIEDHRFFWEELYELDQGYRGKETNDSLDNINLVKACIYLNKFGYPDSDAIGRKSSIINLIWIHNKYPKVDKYTFPIILEGFQKKEISNKEFRNYFINHIYRRYFDDEGIDHLLLSELFQKCELNTARVNIDELITLIEMEKGFLELDHQILGIWQQESVLDSIELNGSWQYIERQPSPIKIFQSVNGQFYIEYLHDDRSHYPQTLISLTDDNRRFQIKGMKTNHIELLTDGTLKISEAKVNNIYKPIRRFDTIGR